MSQPASGVFQKFPRELPSIPGLLLTAATQQPNDHANGERTQNHGQWILLRAFLTGIPSTLHTVLGEAGNSVGSPACPRVFFR